MWVRGNHDSADFQDALGRLENTIVLDGETAEVDDFTIYGLGHPYFNEQRGTPTGDEDVVELVEAAAERVTADVGALPEPPDIVLVHDDRMAAGIAGMVPLVLSGHFHENRDEVVDGTAVPPRGDHRRRGADRLHRRGRRAVLGRGPVFPGRRGRRRDAARRVGRRDAVPRDGEPRDRATPGVRRRRVAEPLLAGFADVVVFAEPFGVSVVPEERTRAIPIEEPYDLAATMFPIRRGTGDPTMRIDGGTVWRAARTPDGPATLRLEQVGDGSVRRRRGEPAPSGRSSTRRR